MCINNRLKPRVEVTMHEKGPSQGRQSCTRAAGWEKHVWIVSMLLHSAQTSPFSQSVFQCLFLFQITLILTHDNEGPNTDREVFSLLHSHLLFFLPLYVSVSLFLWQSKPDAMGQRVKGPMVVVMCSCTCQWPDMWVCACMIWRWSEVRTGGQGGGGEENRRGNERTCQTRSQLWKTGAEGKGMVGVGGGHCAGDAWRVGEGVLGGTGH